MFSFTNSSLQINFIKFYLLVLSTSFFDSCIIKTLL
jgi:hypothetical protein